MASHDSALKAHRQNVKHREHNRQLRTRLRSALRDIPAGETRSYGQLAASLGRPKASRAVGHANSLNPVGIIVPCHRVIGANGKLTGYAGGLHRKEWLLRHEQQAYKPLLVYPMIAESA